MSSSIQMEGRLIAENADDDKSFSVGIVLKTVNWLQNQLMETIKIFVYFLKAILFIKRQNFKFSGNLYLIKIQEVF